MRSSWACRIPSRRSEHSNASSAFAPLVGEEAAFEREVLRNMSATVRADTDTDRAGILQFMAHATKRMTMIGMMEITLFITL